MRYTRQLWNDVLTCHRAKVDPVALVLVSVFLAVLPVTFYVASYINSPDVSSNILQREFVSDLCSYIAVFMLKRDVKLQPTNQPTCSVSCTDRLRTSLCVSNSVDDCGFTDSQAYESGFSG